MRDVIIACDFKDLSQTLAFLQKFQAEKPYLKIGMELFYREGPALVRHIKEMGHPVFLDLKLHDIPNTVKRAMANLASLHVDMVNVHAAGTRAMMEAAREGLRHGGAETKLIAVTQLTSTSAASLRDELLIETAMEETVARYAQNAKEAGLDGVVCSALEAPRVKEACGAGFLAVTPGIRYPDGDEADQRRVTTPSKARELAADYIVVGRPITEALQPVEAYRQFRHDFVGGCSHA